MALPKSGKSGSNVTNLADARKKRASDSVTTDAPNDENSADVSASNQPLSSSAAVEKPAASAPARVSNRRFDREKVDRIKAEIANGDYKIDHLRVADKYIEHERFS